MKKGKKGAIFARFRAESRQFPVFFGAFSPLTTIRLSLLAAARMVEKLRKTALFQAESVESFHVKQNENIFRLQNAHHHAIFTLAFTRRRL